LTECGTLRLLAVYARVDLYVSVYICVCVCVWINNYTHGDD